jgi:hypothetical protein
MLTKAPIGWLITLFIASNSALAAPVQQPGEEAGFKLLENPVFLLDKTGQQSGTADDWNAAILGLAKDLKAAPESSEEKVQRWRKLALQFS